TAITDEYSELEENLSITRKEIDLPEKVLTNEESNVLIKTLQSAFNGVYRMSPDIEGLVETSNNIARVQLRDGKIEIQCLTRSSVETGKKELAGDLIAGFGRGGFEVTTYGEYARCATSPY